MTPVSTTIAHHTEAIGPNRFKHTSLLVVHSYSVTQEATTDFTSMDKQIQQQLYNPLLSQLSLALATYRHDPTSALTKLQSMKAELESTLL